MGKNVVCSCKCGCKDKAKLFSTGDMMIAAGLGKKLPAGPICNNCRKGNHKKNNSEQSIDTLKKRLANGEITLDEYYRLKSIVEND